jgi:hypothetical protein
MAKTTLPLLGVAASGSIGRSIVFGRWKGINYARQHAAPANPRTAAQVSQRDLMTYVVGLWQRMPASVQDAYNAGARGTAMSGYNLWAKRNLVSLRGDANNDDLVVSPGVGGGVGIDDLSASYSGGTITVEVTPGVPVSGTTIERVHAVAVPRGAPAGMPSGVVVSGSDSTSPYQVLLNVGTEPGSYVVATFVEGLAPGGRVVYGVSLNTVVNVP